MEPLPVSAVGHEICDLSLIDQFSSLFLARRDARAITPQQE